MLNVICKILLVAVKYFKKRLLDNLKIFRYFIRTAWRCFFYGYYKSNYTVMHKIFTLVKILVDSLQRFFYVLKSLKFYNFPCSPASPAICSTKESWSPTFNFPPSLCQGGGRHIFRSLQQSWCKVPSKKCLLLRRRTLKQMEREGKGKREVE